MNIIFGSQEAEKLSDKHIVLELDTITMGSSTPITAFCVVENIPIDKMSLIEPYRNIHNDLIENYKKRNWNYCEQAIEELVGFWGGELDSFYIVLNDRIKEYKDNEPDESWTGIISK